MKTPLTVFALGLLLVFCFPAAAGAQSPVEGTRDSLRRMDSANRNDRTFTKVEFESQFPGGTSAWLAFLNEHLRYPDKAVRKKIEGTVVLQFIVDKDGSVIDLQAISGDPILAKAALKAMEHTPKWIPATQNGRIVKSYKKQPVVFRLTP